MYTLLLNSKSDYELGLNVGILLILMVKLLKKRSFSTNKLTEDRSKLLLNYHDKDKQLYRDSDYSN